MRALATGSFVVAVLLLLATPAFSQPAVAGIVRDTSGAILPGVNVEAASPALIEKVAHCRDRWDRPVPDRRSASPAPTP